MYEQFQKDQIVNQKTLSLERKMKHY